MKNSGLTNANGVPIKSYATFEFVETNNLGEITYLATPNEPFKGWHGGKSAW